MIYAYAIILKIKQVKQGGCFLQNETKMQQHVNLIGLLILNKFFKPKKIKEKIFFALFENTL